jgi:hypothetical protein
VLRCPRIPAVLERWVWDPLEPATRLWLTLQLAEADLDPPRERRLLFTPCWFGPLPQGRLSDATRLRQTVPLGGGFAAGGFSLLELLVYSRDRWHLGHHGAGAARP